MNRTKRRTSWFIGAGAALALSVTGAGAFAQSAGDDNGLGGTPTRLPPRGMDQSAVPGATQGTIPGATQGTFPGATQATAPVGEAQRQLSIVDGYLRTALNGTKLIYANAQMLPGRVDTSLQREEAGNVDRAISQALSHIAVIKSMPAGQAMVDPRQLSQLQTELMQARGVVAEFKRTIPGLDRGQLASSTSRLYGLLRSADERFGQIAETESLTRIDRVEVPERQPVSGQVGGQPSGQMGGQTGGQYGGPSGAPSSTFPQGGSQPGGQFEQPQPLQQPGGMQHPGGSLQPSQPSPSAPGGGY